MMTSEYRWGRYGAQVFDGCAIRFDPNTLREGTIGLPSAFVNACEGWSKSGPTREGSVTADVMNEWLRRCSTPWHEQDQQFIMGRPFDRVMVKQAFGCKRLPCDVSVYLMGRKHDPVVFAFGDVTIIVMPVACAQHCGNDPLPVVEP